MLAYTRQAISLDGPVFDRFKALAKELDMAIAVSFLQHLPMTGGTGSTGLGGRPPQNSVALIDRFGNVAYNCASMDIFSVFVPAASAKPQLLVLMFCCRASCHR